MRAVMVRHRNAVYLSVLIALAVGLWLPRLRGPLDLRYDAGVYYILGTSLAEGKGYRLLSEPGQIQAIQYPPLLPLLGTATQCLAGSDDPAIVGHWLRISFFVLFLAFAVSVYWLSRCYLASGAAFLATLVMLLHVHTTWMSELFFAELPFAFTSVLFLLVARQGTGRSREWLLGTLGSLSFLLRGMGITLLAAWVGESLLRRRFREMVFRSALALIPVLGWHGYIAHVKGGPEYVHPAYEYQRAGYQFNNVGYLENLAYIDPFAPELGTVSAQALVERVAWNVVRMPSSLGTAVSVNPGWVKSGLKRVSDYFGILPIPLWFANVPIAAIGILVLLGLVRFAVRREWLVVLYVTGSAGFICLTPWVDQFDRYLWPLTPVLASALIMALFRVRDRVSATAGGRWRVASVAFIATVIFGILLVQSVLLVRIYQGRNTAFYRDEGGKQREYRLFFYTPAWQFHDAALDWLRGKADPHEIVATSTPHWAYLKTGLFAVMPPFEPDVLEAAHLIDRIAVKYLLLDCGSPLVPSAESSITAGRPPVDISRRYALPVVTSFPERWKLVYSSPEGHSQIYQRVNHED